MKNTYYFLGNSDGRRVIVMNRDKSRTDNGKNDVTFLILLSFGTTISLTLFNQ